MGCATGPACTAVTGGPLGRLPGYGVSRAERSAMKHLLMIYGDKEKVETFAPEACRR